MIHIQKYPRLGEHGWSAAVTWDNQAVDILLVGSHATIVDRAHSLERTLKPLAQRGPDPTPLHAWRPV